MSANMRDRDLDRLLVDWMADAAPRRVPDRVLEGAFARTSGARQSWSWRPRPLTDARRRGLLIALPLLALLGLLVASSVLALLVGQHHETTPTPTPRSSALASPTTPTTTPGPNPSAPLGLVPPAQMAYDQTGSSIGEVHGAIPVQLPDGSAVFIGGRVSLDSRGYAVSVKTVERFDPTTMTFSQDGGLLAPRLFPEVALLDSGLVLVVGGVSADGAVAAAELWNPATGASTPLPSVLGYRRQGTATLLEDGNVLIVGGSDGDGNDLGSSLLFDPVVGSFSPSGSLHTARMLASAIRLQNGDVLVVGGVAADAPTQSAELYHAGTETFQQLPSMAVARVLPALALLPNGDVLIVSPDSPEAELFDPVTDRFSKAGTMAAPHAVEVTLTDGRVLVAGGGSTTLEVFDPATSTFTATSTQGASPDVDAALRLPDGRVLLAAGSGEASAILDPVAHAATADAPTSTPSPSPSPSPTPSPPAIPRACSLLTPTELRAATSLVPGRGDPSSSSPGESDCYWHGKDVFVAVKPFRAEEWAALQGSPVYSSVRGVGDATLASTQGDLWVRKGDWLVEVNVTLPKATTVATRIAFDLLPSLP